MGMLICNGAMCQCSFGVAPTALIVIPKNNMTSNMPVATITDSAPITNLPSFGMCSSMANPTVASATSAATAAALGVFTLTPMPCVPATGTPWTPGSPTVLVGGVPALNESSKAMCSYGGVISIITPTQVTTQVP